MSDPVLPPIPERVERIPDFDAETLDDAKVLSLLKESIRVSRNHPHVLAHLLIAWEIRAYRMVEEAQAAAAMAMAGRTIEKMEDMVKRP